MNLDSETKGELYIGCAGGIDITCMMEYKETPVDKKKIALNVTLKGPRGGHSGMEINQDRLEELTRGYRTDERVLRASRVTVGKA